MRISPETESAFIQTILMKTIEFIGPPGSGKSTLCLCLQKTLDISGTPNVAVIGTDFYPGRTEHQSRLKSGRTALKRLAPLFAAFSEALSAFPILIQSYAKGTRLKTPGYFRIFRLSLIQSYRRISFLKLMPDKSVGLFDPGAMMRLLNGYLYAYTEPAGDEIEMYLKRVPLPHVLIVVRVDPETALARLHSRPRGLPMRMRQLGPEKWSAVIRQGNAAASIIAEEASKIGVVVLGYDSEELTCDEMAERVMSRLDDI